MSDIKQLNNLIGEIYHGVTSDEVLEVGPQGFKVGGKLLPTKDILRLKSDAGMIQSTFLWELLNKRIRYIAQLKSCEKAEKFEDIIFAKAIIFALQEIQGVLNILDSYQTVETKKE